MILVDDLVSMDPNPVFFSGSATQQSNKVTEFQSFTDVTIACDGQSCKAHKMILSACSPYFKVRYLI